MTDCYKCGTELTADNSYPSARRTAVTLFQVCKDCRKGAVNKGAVNNSTTGASRTRAKQQLQQPVVQQRQLRQLQPTTTDPTAATTDTAATTAYNRVVQPQHNRVVQLQHNPDPLTAEDREALEEVKRIRRTGTWHRMVVEDEQNTALVTPYDQPEEEVVVVDPYRPNKKDDDEGSQDTD